MGPVLDPVDDQIEPAGIHVPLVGCPDQGGPELGPIEVLARAAPLDHPGRLRLAPLEAGEAPAALAALAATADRGASLRAAALQHVGLGAAGRAVHRPHSLLGVVARL